MCVGWNVTKKIKVIYFMMTNESDATDEAARL